MPPPPVRCFTCSRLLGNKWGRYWEMVRDDVPEREACDRVGIPAEFDCCRITMLTTPPDGGLDAPYEPPAGSRFTLQSVELAKRGETTTRTYPAR